jgi:hypothetical protein
MMLKLLTLLGPPTPLPRDLFKTFLSGIVHEPRVVRVMTLLRATRKASSHRLILLISYFHNATWLQDEGSKSRVF